jgi:hypothetical protein
VTFQECFSLSQFMLSEVSHSKEGKTGGKNPWDAIFSKNHGNPIGDHLTPIIDKIAISIPYPDTFTLNLLQKTMPDKIKNTKVFLPAKKRGPYYICRHVTLDEVHSHLFFGMFPSTTKASSFARFEFNPATLSQKGMGLLHDEMEQILPDGFAYLYQHGVVRRIDVALDIHGVEMDQFMLWQHQGTTARDYCSHGKIQTMYLGKLGTNHTIVYNKSGELKQKRGIDLGFPAIRVERHLIGQKISLKELETLPNPFAAMVISPCLPGPPNPKKAKEWTIFGDCCRIRGIKNALSLLPEDRAKYYKSYLKDHQHPWWDPEDAWKLWLPYLHWLRKDIPSHSGWDQSLPL